MTRNERYRRRKEEFGYRQISLWLTPDARAALQSLRIQGLGDTAEIVNTAIVRYHRDVARESA
jgi:hypothetical protein